MANTNIFGALGVPNDDYAFLNTFGQEVVYEATTQILDEHNDEMEIVQEIFVERETEAHAIKYKLEGFGRMQRRGRQSKPGESKAVGEWAVGFPLEDFADAIAFDDVTWGYMTLGEYDRQLRGTMNRDRNTFRAEILKALFNNTARPFVDENWPNITVQPLANTDGTLYPPVIGSEVPAASNHYLGVAANAQQFTDANNPIPLLVNTLEQHFGTPTGGSEIVVLMNNAQTQYAQGLAGFDTVPNRFVTYGANANLQDVDRPPYLPGRVLGEADSALLVEWRWIPAGYMLAVHLGAPRPLMKRVDPAKTGLRRGLHLFAEDLSRPFIRSSWRNRYGMGVGNRLNGVAIDLTGTTANTYTIPTLYAA